MRRAGDIGRDAGWSLTVLVADGPDAAPELTWREDVGAREDRASFGVVGAPGAHEEVFVLRVVDGVGVVLASATPTRPERIFIVVRLSFFVPGFRGQSSGDEYVDISGPADEEVEIYDEATIDDLYFMRGTPPSDLEVLRLRVSDQQLDLHFRAG
jgi:hypothetical protein